MNTDWVKVGSIQSLLVKKADELSDELDLPFVVESMRIWQGYERTKDRLHIVCEAPFSEGRFHRQENEPLCTRSPELDESDYNEPVPCLACLGRLIKIEAKLKGYNVK